MRNDVRLLRLAAACAAGVLLSGCATNLALHQMQKPPEIALLDVAGVTRPQVEKEFGQPARQHHNVSTYRYFVPDRRLSPLLLPAVVLLDVYTVGTMGSGAQRTLKAGMKETNVVYAPSGRVVDWWHERTDRGAASDFRDWLDSGTDEHKLDRLFASAYAGYAPAHFALALRYRYGVWGAEPDAVSAYKWTRLAAFGGHAAARDAVATWRPILSAEQVALAERLVSAWPENQESR